MSNSADSLRKKVCVTVFLDELFEEVLDDNNNWEDVKQVKELPENQVKSTHNPYKKTSLVELGSDEKINVNTNASSQQHQVLLRPRKHRRQSKFSKNNSNSFKNELHKYDYGSCDKTGNECPQSFESSFSESDFDFNEILDLNKSKIINKPSSLSELSKVDVAEKNLITKNVVFPPSGSPSKSGTKSSRILFCEKSTQFECVAQEVKPDDNDVFIDKDDQIAKENVLAWKKIQKEITLLLARAKSRQLEIENSEIEKPRSRDASCNATEYTTVEKSTLTKNSFANVKNIKCKISTDFKKLKANLGKSRSCMLLQTKQTSTSTSEVKELWSVATTHRNLMIEDSDANCQKALNSFRKDSLLFYTLCVKSKRSFEEKTKNNKTVGVIKTNEITDDDDDEDEDEDDDEDDDDDDDEENVIDENSDDDDDDDDEEDDDEEDDDEDDEDDDDESNENLNTLKLIYNSEFVSRESFSEEIHYRLIPKSSLDSICKKISNSNLNSKEKCVSDERIFIKKTDTRPKAENRNKNYAEGDTCEKSFHQDLNFILDIQEKEKQKLLVYDGILKHVPQTNIIHNEIIINRAEIGLLGDARRKVLEKQKDNNSSCQSIPASESFAQVYIKPKKYKKFEESLTDGGESEMPFADSEIFDSNASEYTLIEKISQVFPRSGKKLCDFNINGNFSREKKNAEIFKDNSLNEVQNHSMEVVFIFSENPTFCPRKN